MAIEEKSGKHGFAKYLLLEEIYNKYSSVFDSSVGDNLLTNTLYLEGIHFNLVYFPLKHLGYKSVISSIADVYCSGTNPVNISVSLGISAKLSKGDIETLIEGISLACEHYSLKIFSFDISSSLTGLSISVATLGSVAGNKVKNKPAETDLICVTGDLGAAYLGLQLLERERKIFEDTGVSPKLEGFEYVIRRQLKPELKLNVLNKIKENNIDPGKMRIVRDGLASEIMHISKEAELGCRIYHDRLPVDHETAEAGRELMFEPVIAALNGGDDFEFIFTCPVKEHEKIRQIEGVSIIGHLVPKEEGNSLVLHDGSLAELKAQGWSDE